MANDDETLTFRLRAVAENMDAFGKAARGADNVNASMIKSRKVADDLAVSNRKLTAARDKESDAAGRVRTAETKLNEVRANAKSKMSQIAAAEERLATARRNSSRATNDANRIEAEFKKVAEGALSRIAGDSGQTAGHRFGFGFNKAVNDGSIENNVNKKSSIIGRIFGRAGTDSGARFTFGFKKSLSAVANNVEAEGSHVGRFFGTGILSGMEGLLRSQAGPVILAGLIAIVATTAPAIGAVLAGGIVFAFGAGLTALAIVFAAKSEAVKAKWRAATKAMGEDLKGIAKPFEGVLIHMADSMRATVGRFAPLLKAAFAVSAGPVQKFSDDVLGALEKFKPAIAPITRAFDQLLASLGPALKGAMGSIASGMIRLSDSVSRNADGLPDLIRGLGELIDQLLMAFAVLNDADGAFKRMTGGVSLVTVFMKGLQAAVGAVLGPLLVMAKYISFVSGTMSALTHSTKASGQSMSDAANEVTNLAVGLRKSGEAANSAHAAHVAHAAALAHSNHVSNAANASARALTATFDRQAAATQHSIDLLNRRANLLLALSGAEIDYQQAVDDATAAVKENGRTHDLNTQKGRDNVRALNAVAAAAKSQRDAMLSANDGNVKAAQAAQTGRAAFIKLAIQMGYSRKEAQKMAADLIAIPNVTRTATLLANKKDLDAKLADVNRQLANKNLTKARIAQLQANKKDLEKKIADALRQLSGKGLIQARIAQLQANKTDLDRKLAAARKALADPNLTRERRAVINATISALQAQIKKAQATINGLKGKTVVVNYSAQGFGPGLVYGTTGRPQAAGGPIKGPGGDTSDRAGLFPLSNNEWVIKAKSSQKYGDKAMASINAGTAEVIPNAGLASGGPARGRGPAPALIKVITKKPFASKAAADKWMNHMMGGPGGPALSWARSQVGKPYIWGGVGPRGYDCSGFQSAIVNVIKGKNPYHRLFATGSLPGSLFARGAGRYNIGWFKGNPGHMAGTLNGVNVESRGGEGVVVGARARGATNGLFNSGVWHLKGYAKGGKVRGDPPFDGFGDWLRDQIPTYKQGTSYVPHDGMAYLHRGEKVTPANRNRPEKFVFEFRGDGSPYMAFLIREFRKYVTVHGGDVQKVLGSRG